MINRKYRKTGTSILINENTVYEYFKLIKDKDINRLLDLFADDAIVFEPFSNIHGGLKGKNTIKPFLEVVVMANDGLQHEIEFEQQQGSTDNKEQVVALVTIERGGRVKARFTFELAPTRESYDSHALKKIQSLRIEFILIRASEVEP